MPSAAARDLQPSWRPDPSGRHDYRWWTGVDWSDQVGDGGVVTIDPGPVPIPTRRTAGVAYRRRRLMVAVGAVTAVGAVAAGVLVAARSDDSGFGVAVLRFDPATGVAERTVELRQGDVVRIRVEPGARIDTAVHLLVDERVALEQAALLAGEGDTADAYADRVFRRPSAVLDDPEARAAAAGELVVATIDSAGAGRPDAGWFVARAPGAYRVVVTEASGRPPGGGVRSIVERSEVALEPGDSAPDTSATFFREPAFYDDDAPYAGD